MMRIRFGLGFFLLVCVLMFLISYNPVYAATDNISLSTSVTEALSMSLSASNYAFGNLTPGTSLKGSGGIDVDVTTSAASGYNLMISDGITGADSALVHTDTTTRIPDCSATITTPVAWAEGTTKGLGVTVFSATTSKESKWGDGTTYNAAGNKYAAIPELAATIHNSPGYKTSADRTSISFIVDVDNTQKTGSYSGNITLTATAVLI